MLLGFFRNFWVSLKVIFRKSFDDKDIAHYWQRKNSLRLNLDVASLVLIGVVALTFAMIGESTWRMVNFDYSASGYQPDFTDDYILSAIVVVLFIYLLSAHLTNFRVLRQFLYQKEALQTVAIESDSKAIEKLRAELLALSTAKASMQSETQREADELKGALAKVTQEKQTLAENLRDADHANTQAASSIASLNSIVEERTREIEKLRAKTLQDALKSAAPNVITDELRQRFLKLRRSAAKDGAAPHEASQYLSWIISTAHEVFPDELARFRDLSYVSEEAKRIAQYDSILALYSDKIAKLRARDMNEEDREEAIYAMKRLRDKEIELLENAEVKGG